MKIGINSRIFQISYSGISYYTKGLYLELQKIDKKNEYIFFQTDKSKKLGRTKVAKIMNNIIGAFLFDNILVRNLCKRNGIDILHGPANILPFFRKKNLKYIVTIHDLAFLANTFQGDNKIFLIYYKYFVRRSLNNADVIIADSFSTKKDILKFYKRINENKIKVIHLGINGVFLKTKENKKRLIDENYIFSLTTHPKRKNINSVLRAIADNESLRDYKYVIAGIIVGDQKRELKELVRKLNLEEQVVLFGKATEDELVNLYQNAAFFIYPSFYEGFGLPVLEAMSCKCPVITSNNSSLVEVTLDDEWLVDPKDLKSIEDKMIRMVNLSAAERGNLINENYFFSKQFNWNVTAKKMLKIIKEL